MDLIPLFYFYFHAAHVLHPVRAVPVGDAGLAALLRVQGCEPRREDHLLDHGAHGDARVHQVREREREDEKVRFVASSV